MAKKIKKKSSRAMLASNLRAARSLFGWSQEELGRRDGTEFLAEISWSAIQEAGDTLVAVAIRNVTERKQLETELLMARDAVEAMRRLLRTLLDGGKAAFAPLESAAPELTSAAIFEDLRSSTAQLRERR
jgi:PAS domain-containing protein